MSLQDLYPTDKPDQNPSERAYNYLMGGASYRNPYLNYADTAGPTPATPSTEGIGDNHWEYDPLTKAWRLVAGKGDTKVVSGANAAVGADAAPRTGSSAPFGRDADGVAYTKPTGGLAGNGTNLTDEQWADVKRLRDEEGLNNPYDRSGLKTLGALFGGISGIGAARKEAQAGLDYLAEFRKRKDAEQAEMDNYASALRAAERQRDAEAAAAAFEAERQAAIDAYSRSSGVTPVDQIPESERYDPTTATRRSDFEGGSGSYERNAETARQYGTTEGSQQTSMLAAQDSDMARGGYIGYAAGGLGSLGSYSDGGRLLRGPGDGVSDGIPALIGKGQPARLADGEFVLPARVVSELGNGSTEAGAKKLYAMMDRIEKAQRKAKRGKDSNADKYLPA